MKIAEKSALFFVLSAYIATGCAFAIQNQLAAHKIESSGILCTVATYTLLPTMIFAPFIGFSIALYYIYFRRSYSTNGLALLLSLPFIILILTAFTHTRRYTKSNNLVQPTSLRSAADE